MGDLPRLDKWLKEKYPDYSRSYFQFLIDEGAVLVNGVAAKKRTPIKESDTVDVTFLLTPEISLNPEPIPLDILFEDESIIVINKPAGLVVHPAPGSTSGTFANALLYHCKNLPGQDTLRPGIIHRLDKGTSGVLVAAKTSQAHAHLSEQFAQRKVEKMYLAITDSAPPPGLIEVPIGRHRLRRKEMTVLKEGKEAKTEVVSVEKGADFFLVHLRLHTGRTHQIRVHLKSKNAPILGDEVYGKPATGVERPLLHAASLSFFHPITGERLSFSAPLPEDMQKFVEQISSYQVK